jgi:hypothetical protein
LTPKKLAPWLAALVSLASGVVAWLWRTGAVGGSDSACYALMAQIFADGAWQPLSVLAGEAPWPDASRVAAPAGFLPSAIREAAAVPVCAPGYSLLIAPLVRGLGPAAVHYVPPLAATALVWCAFLVARRLAGSPTGGVVASLLVATTPIVLFQAVQPMNDITTGALWAAVAWAMVTRRPVVTGALVGVALLVRPNLAIAGAVALLMVAWLRAAMPQPGWPARTMRTLAVAAAAALPGVLAALALNRVLYGSPFQSGYGDLGVLFAAEHVTVNLMRYGCTWLVSGTPVVLLCIVAWWEAPRERRLETAAVTVLAASLSLVYLAYRPFDEWWYLRFMLPSVALAAMLSAVCLTAAAERRWPRQAPALVVLVVALVSFYTLQSVYAREALGLRALEARFPDTADVVATRLDQGAVPITIWQSGGLRFWPGREVVAWDALESQWLDQAVSWLQIHGRQPVIVVERWEEEGFRSRFAGQVYGGLDWPPRFDVDRRVRIFVPEDREPYLAGEPIPTETIFGARYVR